MTDFSTLSYSSTSEIPISFIHLGITTIRRAPQQKAELTMTREIIGFWPGKELL